MPVILIIAGSRRCNPTPPEITSEVLRLPIRWDLGADGSSPPVVEQIRERISEVVTGDAPGSDRAGARWAAELGIPVHHEPVTREDIERWGKYLGPRMRNRRMAERATHAICFWDGQSAGTPDMAMRMLCRGKYVQAAPHQREKRHQTRPATEPKGRAAPA
jgi:hypothetical protein